jgi:hypothetical protein
MFNRITSLCLGMVIAVSLPTILEANDIAQPPSPKVAYMLLANKIGTAYGVSIPTMKRIVKCESSWDSLAINSNKREYSVGLSQINLKAHKDITKEQAEDPAFALNYLAQGLSTNHGSQWSCYKVK